MSDPTTELPEIEPFSTPALDAMMAKLQESEGDTASITTPEMWAAAQDAYLALGASLNEAGALYQIAGGIMEQLRSRQS